MTKVEQRALRRIAERQRGSLNWFELMARDSGQFTPVMRRSVEDLKAEIALLEQIAGIEKRAERPRLTVVK